MDWLTYIAGGTMFFFVLFLVLNIFYAGAWWGQHDAPYENKDEGYKL